MRYSCKNDRYDGDFMTNFILSFNIIFPIFMIMVIGYVLGRMKIISDKTNSEMNKVVFKVCLPLQLFNNVYTSNITESFNPMLVALAAVSVLAIFGVAMLIAVTTEKDNAKRGVMAQGMFRANFVIFGVPVVTALFGDEAAAKASILIAVVVPMFNVLAVIALTVFGSAQFNAKKILKGIVTNPLIIASLLGLAFLIIGIPIPSQIHTVIKDLGKIATPLAFILLGASFKFGEVRQYIKHLSITLTMRLILFPLGVIIAGVLLGFRNAELAILLTMSGSPVAVSSYTMAQQMGGDDKLAGQLVVLSSILCIITMFLWIFTLKQFAFM